MVPNEAEAPFVVLEALNISGVIGATYFRSHLCVFLRAGSPGRVLDPKLRGWWGEAGGLQDVRPRLVGWKGLDFWGWSWRTAGLSVLRGG